MSEELERRIHNALDAGARPDDDAELVEALERDDDLRATARELERVDAALRQWPTPERDDEAWEALAARIESRLDEELEPMGDPTAPPPADESTVPEEGSGTYERSGKAAAAAPSQAQAPTERSGERPGGMPWTVGLALAAIALLAVGAFTLMEAGSPDEEVALAPSEGAPSPTEQERAGSSGGAPASADQDERRGAAEAEDTAAEAGPGDDSSGDPKAVAAAEPEQPVADEVDEDEGADKERLRRRARTARRAAGSSSHTSGGGGSTSGSRDSFGDVEQAGRSAGGGGGKGALPATPSDEAVDEAVRVLQGKVRACAAETDAAVQVRVTVRGATGRPKHVAVLGELAETEAGVCVQRVLRHLELPRFRRAKHTFTHRFTR